MTIPKSRLDGMRVYLAGPLENALNEGVGWRLELTPKLEKLGLEVLDPTKKEPEVLKLNSLKDSNGLMKRLRKEGKYDELTKNMKRIAQFDLRHCDSADFVISNWDNTIVTVGTVDEIITVRNQKKPVFIRCVQGKHEMPTWFFARVPHNYFYNTFDEILEKLEKIAYCPLEELNEHIDKYWLFI